MFSIFQQIGNVFSSLITILEVIWWVISGLDDVVVLLNSALNSLIAMLDIFPEAAAQALMGVCGGLFVLRIFGRS